MNKLLSVALAFALGAVALPSLAACGATALPPAVTPTPVETATPVPTATPASTSYDDNMGLRLTLPGSGWSSPKPSSSGTNMIITTRGVGTDERIAVMSGYVRDVSSSDITNWHLMMIQVFDQTMPASDPPVDVTFGDYRGMQGDGVVSGSDGTDLHMAVVYWLAHNRVHILDIGMLLAYWARGGKRIVDQIVSSAEPY